MTIKFGMVMDPIESIKIEKDSSFAMMLEAQKRGWEIYYIQQQDLYFNQDQVYTNAHVIHVQDDPRNHFQYKKAVTLAANELDVIVMRKDPPFDMEYIYTTYLLELIEVQGTLIVNKPQSLRDANEKMYTTWFAHCCPATVVTRQAEVIRKYAKQHGDIVIKPLEGMGGKSVFHTKLDNPNFNVIIETLTDSGKHFITAQKFIPDIKDTGDKRILMIDGEPIMHGLARLPAPGESRGNLAVGAKGIDFELSERDVWICNEIGPTLKAKGLMFVGIDVIGDYLTEINVTSPTCIREIEALSGIKVSEKLLDAIESKIESR